MKRPAHLTEPRWVRGVLLALALGFLGLFLLLPLIVVFAEALSKGCALYLDAIADPDAWAAIRLTLWVAALALPRRTPNRFRSRAAAWCVRGSPARRGALRSATLAR